MNTPTNLRVVGWAGQLLGTLTLLWMILTGCSPSEGEPQSVGRPSPSSSRQRDSVLAGAGASGEQQGSGDTGEYPSRLLNSTSGIEYGGVGLELSTNGRVTDVLPGFPAATAGVRVGDVIVSVDGRPTDDDDGRDIAREIRGEPGTSVTISFQRQGESSARTVRLERVLIVAPRETPIVTFHRSEGAVETGRRIDMSIDRLETSGVWGTAEGHLFLERLLRENRRGFIQCYAVVDEAELSSPQSLYLELTIRDEEHEARMLESTIASTVVESCLIQRVTALTVRPAAGELSDPRATFELVFSNE